MAEVSTIFISIYLISTSEKTIGELILFFCWQLNWSTIGNELKSLLLIFVIIYRFIIKDKSKSSSNFSFCNVIKANQSVQSVLVYETRWTTLFLFIAKRMTFFQLRGIISNYSNVKYPSIDVASMTDCCDNRNDTLFHVWHWHLIEFVSHVLINIIFVFLWKNCFYFVVDS